jgi:hypothetical protein
MATAPLLLLCSALLNQGVPEAPPEGTPQADDAPLQSVQPPDQAPPVPGGPAADRPAVEAGKSPLPQMRWDQVAQCGYLRPTKEVPSGHFRIQCDDKIKVCLTSPTRVLLEDGIEGPEPLARVSDCAGYYGEDWGQKARAGYRFFPAVAEAPPGWIRDERGRVMQVNFDLNRRVLLGGAWAPVMSRADPRIVGRMRADFGIEIEFPGEDSNVLNRIHLLDTGFFLGPDTITVDATLIRYDWSVARQAPLFWVSTFIGTPRRHDFSMDAGGWFEALHLETLKRGATETNNFLTLGTVNLTLDLWHSRDLVSYLRVRAGPSAEVDTTRGFTSLKPVAALEFDATLDEGGFQHLHVAAEAEKLFFDSTVEGRVRNPSRLRLTAGYEHILIAINDYPLSFVLDGRATWRDDLPNIVPGWEFGAEAGLRFSFWAPARRAAVLQAQQQPAAQ